MKKYILFKNIKINSICTNSFKLFTNFGKQIKNNRIDIRNFSNISLKYISNMYNKIDLNNNKDYDLTLTNYSKDNLELNNYNNLQLLTDKISNILNNEDHKNNKHINLFTNNLEYSEKLREYLRNIYKKFIINNNDVTETPKFSTLLEEIKNINSNLTSQDSLFLDDSFTLKVEDISKIESFYNKLLYFLIEKNVYSIDNLSINVSIYNTIKDVISDLFICTNFIEYIDFKLLDNASLENFTFITFVLNQTFGLSKEFLIKFDKLCLARAFECTNLLKSPEYEILIYKTLYKEENIDIDTLETLIIFKDLFLLSQTPDNVILLTSLYTIKILKKLNFYKNLNVNENTYKTIEVLQEFLGFFYSLKLNFKNKLKQPDSNNNNYNEQIQSNFIEVLLLTIIELNSYELNVKDNNNKFNKVNSIIKSLPDNIEKNITEFIINVLENNVENFFKLERSTEYILELQLIFKNSSKRFEAYFLNNVKNINTLSYEKQLHLLEQYGKEFIEERSILIKLLSKNINNISLTNGINIQLPYNKETDVTKYSLENINSEIIKFNLKNLSVFSKAMFNYKIKDAEKFFNKICTDKSFLKVNLDSGNNLYYVTDFIYYAINSLYSDNNRFIRNPLLEKYYLYFYEKDNNYNLLINKDLDYFPKICYIIGNIAFENNINRNIKNIIKLLPDYFTTYGLRLDSNDKKILLSCMQILFLLKKKINFNDLNLNKIIESKILSNFFNTIKFENTSLPKYVIEAKEKYKISFNNLVGFGCSCFSFNLNNITIHVVSKINAKKDGFQLNRYKELNYIYIRDYLLCTDDEYVISINLDQFTNIEDMFKFSFDMLLEDKKVYRSLSINKSYNI